MTTPSDKFRLTIARADNIVIVDGRALNVDCSALPADVRVVQWDGARGHTEHVPNAQGRHVPNKAIDSIEPFAAIVGAWRAAAHEADNPPEPKVEHVKEALLAHVDALAEGQRLAHLTGGAGMALVYERKGDEAARWAAAGFPKVVDPSAFPFAVARAAAFGMAPDEVLAEWAEKSAAWTGLAIEIENVREAAKLAVKAAADRASALAAVEGIRWPAA
jgi:hypothetical protein